MKWYLALNEGGTRGDIGLHTKLAVLSALQHTDLAPHLLYTGNRNGFTEWLEARGVNIINSRLPYLSVIEELAAAGRYHMLTVGHWLRTNVCLEEREDEHVFYTDVDVLFLKRPELAAIQPRYFAAAPEFDPTSWNYFNAGVMVLSPQAMRDDYAGFERYLVETLREKTHNFHDQIAYNVFYRGRWDRLPLELNWKPYWGLNDAAALLHFHGPKLGAISAIVEDRWHWDSNHGRQIGSLFIRHFESYLHAFQNIEAYIPALDAAEQDYLGHLLARLRSFDPTPHMQGVDVKFMDFRMFPE
ncbi:hypothetical protein ACELLULO517_06010 [Acidisoma cellulosilytica]|uniref:Uncharacterized protein n=1 Tax=Acidisoma cellulosilyticum TaxID=2802395 RepID=A0A964E2U6_9PROT|nr:hypothetical protein [Acidisoma cellulosilyticum]MCB8879781.1 hypothetical protein [Acidisoma cellulosilyticum]